jgi:hypothetical protein
MNITIVEPAPTPSTQHQIYSRNERHQVLEGLAHKSLGGDTEVIGFCSPVVSGREGIFYNHSYGSGEKGA